MCLRDKNSFLSRTPVASSCWKGSIQFQQGYTDPPLWNGGPCPLLSHHSAITLQGSCQNVQTGWKGHPLVPLWLAEPPGQSWPGAAPWHGVRYLWGTRLIEGAERWRLEVDSGCWMSLLHSQLLLVEPLSKLYLLDGNSVPSFLWGKETSTWRVKKCHKPLGDAPGC